MTLIQTQKIRRKVALVLYGKAYWDKVLNLDALVDAGTISPEDVHLFHTSDSVDEAFGFLTEWLQENILSQGEDEDSDYFA